jgi:hypothetical protein
MKTILLLTGKKIKNFLFEYLEEIVYSIISLTVIIYTLMKLHI